MSVEAIVIKAFCAGPVIKSVYGFLTDPDPSAMVCRVNRDLAHLVLAFAIGRHQFSREEAKSTILPPLLQQVQTLSFCHRPSIAALKSLARLPKLVGVHFRCRLTVQTIQDLVKHCGPIIGTLLGKGEVKVTDAHVVYLANNCQRLRRLDIHGCVGVTDVALAALAQNCTELRHLNLAMCIGVSDAGIMALAGCHRLTSIDISMCTGVTDKGMVALAKNCPELKRVNLSGDYPDALPKGWATFTPIRFEDDNAVGPLVSDVGMVALGTHCKQLQSIRTRYNKTITDDSLVAIGQNCKKIESIDFSHCSRLTNVGIVALVSGNPMIHTVQLVCVGGIGDTGAIALANHCPRLGYLSLYGRRALTDDALIALAHHCPELYFVSFAWNNKVSDKGAIELGKHCSKLAHFDLRGSQVTDTGVMSMLGNGVLDPSTFNGFKPHSTIHTVWLEQCPNVTDRAKKFFKWLGLDLCEGGASDSEESDYEESDSEGSDSE